MIIEINQSIGEPLETMREMVAAHNLKYPVLWDEACQNTREYGITAWPIAYLIGPDGKVFWEGKPTRWIREGRENDAMRRTIERKLAEAMQ